MTRNRWRLLREGNGRLCKVRIPRNNALDKIAIVRPGKKMQRTRSVSNLQSGSPTSNISRPIVAQLDMSKIRSILSNPTDKPRCISFGRRKSLPSHVTFNVSNLDSPQGNAAMSSSQQDNAPLIDFSGDDDIANASTNTIPTIGELLQPTIAPMTQKQTTQTETNQNSILDEFDPLLTATDTNDSTTNWSAGLTPTKSTSSPSNCDQITPSPRVRRLVPDLMPINSVLVPSSGNKVTPSPRVHRPVPNLLPIKSVLSTSSDEVTPSPRLHRSVPNLMPIKSVLFPSTDNKVTPSPRVNRPVPNLMPIKSNCRILVTREALSNALRIMPSTSSGDFHAARRDVPDLHPIKVVSEESIDIDLPVPEKTSDDTTFDQTLQFDSSGEQYGKLQYESDSDSDFDFH